MSQPCWGGFPSSIARQPRGCQHGTISIRKALGETFPTPTFLTPALFQPWILSARCFQRRACLAPVLFQPWKYQSRKVGPVGCDIRRSIYTVYSLDPLSREYLKYLPGIREFVNLCFVVPISARTPCWWWCCCCCCCLHIQPFFLPNDISSTPSVLPDSSS